MSTAVNLFLYGNYCYSEIGAVFAAHLITDAFPIGLNGCLSVC